MSTEQAERECAIDCLYLGISAIAGKDYGDAAVHLENAARSLKELQKIEEEKKNEKYHIVSVCITGTISDDL